MALACGYRRAVTAEVSERGLRVSSAVRLLWAGALLARPGAALRLLGAAPAVAPAPARGASAVRAARLLGVRHAVQAVVALAVGPPALLPGAAIDALHAASMAALARLVPAYARPARHDAIVESAFA